MIMHREKKKSPAKLWCTKVGKQGWKEGVSYLVKTHPRNKSGNKILLFQKLAMSSQDSPSILILEHSNRAQPYIICTMMIIS